MLSNVSLLSRQSAHNLFQSGRAFFWEKISLKLGNIGRKKQRFLRNMCYLYVCNAFVTVNVATSLYSYSCILVLLSWLMFNTNQENFGLHTCESKVQWTSKQNSAQMTSQAGNWKPIIMQKAEESRKLQGRVPMCKTFLEGLLQCKGSRSSRPVLESGAPKDNFWKISVRKTI